VELSQDGQFQLRPSDADILVQMKSQHLLWQKERLLNVALKSVPRDCRTVAWLDCDVVFEERDWAARTADLLQEFKIVEPFSLSYEIPRNEFPGGPKSKQDQGYSLLYANANEIAGPDVLRGNMRLKRVNSGLAWAARREFLDEHGFYDACVMGSGNRAIACAALGRFDDAIHYLQMNPAWTRHYMNWAKPYFDAVRGDVGWADGALFHLWHGELEHRRYAERHAYLSEWGFDPAKDIVIDDNGAWRWGRTRTKAHMEKIIYGYFQSRREDG
jgi:hypothetical protein